MFIYLYFPVLFMNKKGVELSINAIVIIILALLVLVVLFFVIQKGIIQGTTNYFNFSESAEKEIASDKICAKMFSGRMCYKSPCPESYIEISGDWDDCKKIQSICCEKK